MRTLILIGWALAAGLAQGQPTARTAERALDRNAFQGRPTILVVGAKQAPVASQVFAQVLAIQVEANATRWTSRVSVLLVIQEQGEREFPALLERLALTEEQLPAAVAVSWDGKRLGFRPSVKLSSPGQASPDVREIAKLRLALGRKARPLTDKTTAQRIDALERADEMLEQGELRDAIKLWNVIISQNKPHYMAAQRAQKQLNKQARAEMETLIRAEDRDLCAYACLGRGADFAHTLHEWAGAPEDVLALAREHVLRERRRGAPGDIALITPPSAELLHARLRELGAIESRGILGLAKLLDPEAAAELIDRYSGPDLRVSVESDSGQATRVTLCGPRASRALSPAEILQLLFPPRGERTLIETLESEIGTDLAELPLRPFAWGLDSI